MYIVMLEGSNFEWNFETYNDAITCMTILERLGQNPSCFEDSVSPENAIYW
jgi:hypothetical protein